MKSYTKAYIPYKGYFSSPFSRWQGSMQNDNAVELGATTAKRWFLEKKIDPTILDYMYFGATVAQNHWFCAHHWAAAMLTDDKKFLKAVGAAGFVNLKGHRSVGGMRASIYNAMPVEGVRKLVEFMKKFEMENK